MVHLIHSLFECQVPIVIKSGLRRHCLVACPYLFHSRVWFLFTDAGNESGVSAYSGRAYLRVYAFHLSLGSYLRSDRLRGIL